MTKVNGDYKIKYTVLSLQIESTVTLLGGRYYGGRHRTVSDECHRSRLFTGRSSFKIFSE